MFPVVSSPLPLFAYGYTLRNTEICVKGGIMIFCNNIMWNKQIAGAMT